MPAKRVKTDLYGDPLPQGAVTRLGTLRYRAPAEIVSLAYAPDGKTIAACSYAGLFLFDAASGKRLRRLDPDSAQVLNNTAVFSPDSKRLALRARTIVGDPKDKTKHLKEVVRVWDLASDRKPKEYDAEYLSWFGWSGENEPLAVCLEKGGLRLHELAARKSRFFACQELRRPELSVYVKCDYAPAGKVLVVVDEQNVVHVWDTANGGERLNLKPKNIRYIRSLALSPDGRTFACLVYDQADKNIVQLRDSSTGKVLHTVAEGQQYLSTVLFAPDGKTLATAGWRGIRFWDVTTGKERSRCEDPVPETEKIAFSGDGKTLAAAERHTPTFHLWDVATGRRKPEPTGHTGRPWYGAFSHDGRHLFTGDSWNGTIHLWNTAAGNSLLQIQESRYVRGLALSADGRTLFSMRGDHVWVCDSASGEKQQGLKLHDPDRPDTYQQPDSLHLSGDGKTLVAFSSYQSKNNRGPNNYDMLITGWDTATYKQLFRRRWRGSEFWTAVSPDVRMLAIPESKLAPEFGKPIPGKGPMRIEDLATGALLVTFPVLEGQTWPLAFSPDGRLLASHNSNYRRLKEGDPSSTGRTVRLWETATTTEVLSLPEGNSQSRAAFSSNGRFLAMTAPPQDILIYDLSAGRELRRFKEFDAEVTSLAFSPDGRRLVSGLADSTLLIWDVGPRLTQPKGKLGAEDAAQAWTDLAGKHGPRAFRARWTLAAAPETAVSLLQKHLKAIQPADSKRLRRLIADLDDKRFLVRQQAQKELEEIGELAAPALKKALAEKSSLEVRQRIDGLLGKLRGPVTRPEMMRAVRAVAVLEDVATDQARKLLEALSQGAPEARLTQEAKTALTRLDKPPR